MRLPWVVDHTAHEETGVEPTIFTDVRNDMTIARGVWSTDHQRALEVADPLEAGTCAEDQC